MKKILEYGNLISVKPKPVPQKFMHKWEKKAQNLIYPDPKKMKEWRELGTGVWPGFIAKENIKVALCVMDELQQGQEFEKIKNEIKKAEKSKGIIAKKVLKTVLYFSKKGPQFYMYYYKHINDLSFYREIKRIEIENKVFEKRFQNTTEQNQNTTEQNQNTTEQNQKEIEQ